MIERDSLARRLAAIQQALATYKAPQTTTGRSIRTIKRFNDSLYDYAITTSPAAPNNDLTIAYTPQSGRLGAVQLYWWYRFNNPDVYADPVLMPGAGPLVTVAMEPLRLLDDYRQVFNFTFQHSPFITDPVTTYIKIMLLASDDQV